MVLWLVQGAKRKGSFPSCFVLRCEMISMLSTRKRRLQGCDWLTGRWSASIIPKGRSAASSLRFFRDHVERFVGKWSDFGSHWKFNVGSPLRQGGCLEKG